MTAAETYKTRWLRHLDEAPRHLSLEDRATWADAQLEEEAAGRADQESDR